MTEKRTSPERELARLAASQLGRRERRTARGLVRVEKASLSAVRQVVRLATDAVAAEAVRVHGLSPASAVRRQSPVLQASLSTELLHSKRIARATGRKLLADELETTFPMALEGAELDAASSFVAAAGLAAAWGAAALQVIAARAPLTRVATTIAPNVDRTVATETARAFNDERNAIIIDFDAHQGGHDGHDDDTKRLAPGMFKVLSAILDGRTCERCFAADGEVVEPHKPFSAGALPFHPRCRCIVEHVIVPKPQRLEDTKIDYELFKAELRDVIRENRIISDRRSLSFVADSQGERRSAEVLTRRFRNEAYATSGPSSAGGRVQHPPPRGGGTGSAAAGASHPRVDYRENPPGTPMRTLDDAKVLARALGVHWDDDEIEFRLAPEAGPKGHPKVPGSLADHVYATYYEPRGRIESGKTIPLSDLRDKRTGKVVVRVNPRILSSDERIVATFAHEAYEIEQVVAAFEANGGRLTAGMLDSLVNEASGTHHIEAWNQGDAKALELRRRLERGEAP